MIPSKFVEQYAWIELEDGTMVATFPENTPPQIRRMIVKSAEAFSLISNFVERVNSGKLQPKTSVKEFQELLNQVD